MIFAYLFFFFCAYVSAAKARFSVDLEFFKYVSIKGYVIPTSRRVGVPSSVRWLTTRSALSCERSVEPARSS